MTTYETERKFLVADPSVIEGAPYSEISQGYLGSATGYSVRVRYMPDPDKSTMVPPAHDPPWPVTNYRLTVKGNRKGPRRPEEEFCIPDEAASLLFEACGSSLIRKNRYPITSEDGNLWVVDEFLDANEGLLLAELEQDVPTSFIKPDWCGDDVTEDERYYNDYLSRHPYSAWED